MGQEENQTIKSFTDLDAWKKSHEIIVLIYLITKEFPKEEIFGIVNQMRRCAVSITSNIAEGFSRQSIKEKIQFYCIALGSLTELQNQLLISKDVKYLTVEKFYQISDKTVIAHKILNGLIKSTKNRLN
jgi:four helix bundle protein